MVAFSGVKPTKIADDHANHATCYAAYNAAADKAVTTADMVAMNGTLTDCIQAETAAFAAPIAAIEIENDATTFGPLATAQTRITAAITDKVSSSYNLCHVMSEAGENGTGTLSRVLAGSCAARSIENVYTYLKDASPPVTD